MSTDNPLDYLFPDSLESLDPEIDHLIKLEEERQSRRIILIPSESTSPLAVRQALGSVFSHVYAEGYPPLRMTREDEELLLDYPYQLAHYRRYADRRFYKGTDYAHFAETLAQRRVAQCFATDVLPADRIYVNVQPLSGAAANNSIYDAFVRPGDTVMGMSLMHGGHLTHGSQFNRSGKWYSIVSYTVDPKTERLDYDAIQALALQHQPKMIIAGYTSYPWAPDWVRFRKIADSVGAVLMADIAHTAGMAIAGAYPSPVGVADVVVFTTHKTICGPRAAVIVTTDEDQAQKVDSAVFPGEQGGPHVNKFVALAVAFRLAQTPQFRALQHQIVRNASALAEAFRTRGVCLAYGGTDTHLLLPDLRSIRSQTGFPLRAEIAARILELAGIVVNKNTIPGDEITALASGIRIGTPWVTQRGMGPAEMDQIADCITRVVSAIRPFSYSGLNGELPRGKIDPHVLRDVAGSVEGLTSRFEPRVGARSGYPHYYTGNTTVRDLGLTASSSSEQQQAALRSGALAVDLTGYSVLMVKGHRARAFLQEMGTADLSPLRPGGCAHTYLLDRKGMLLDDLGVLQMEPDDRGRDRYLLIAHPEKADAVKSWMRGISDGYVLFDAQDIFRKVQGPVTVEDLSHEMSDDSRRLVIGVYGPAADSVVLEGLGAGPVAPGTFAARPYEGSEVIVARPLRAQSVNGHVVIGSPESVRSMWPRLERAGAGTAGQTAMRDVRAQLGLPPLEGPAASGRELLAADPELFALHKPYFVGQAELPASANQAARPTFQWAPPASAPLLRTPLYPTHARLARKLIPFAGWEMPVWYTSVSEEHTAVRHAAGLFDVAHMGVLEVAGEGAADFLDVVSTNYARWIEPGQSHYGTLLDPDGNALDDIWVYHRAKDQYMVVVNAANADKDWAWLNAVNEGQVLIDRSRPERRVPAPVRLRNLKDPSSGHDRRVDLALQGPASLRILQTLAGSDTLAGRLARIRRTELVEMMLQRIPLVIARTGYTGEPVGFELFVHPDQAQTLWDLLLERGAQFGIKPAGLAARDSTRIEAGMPLYGHELAGDYSVSPIEAGFAPYVKFHKPFFVGRDALMARERASTMIIVRFRANAAGTRAFRGHELVMNRRGQYIGRVTSCTAIGGYQMGMAYIDRRFAAASSEIAVFPASERDLASKPFDQMAAGDRLPMYEWCTVLSRFRTPDEIQHAGARV